MRWMRQERMHVPASPPRKQDSTLRIHGTHARHATCSKVSGRSHRGCQVAYSGVQHVFRPYCLTFFFFPFSFLFFFSCFSSLLPPVFFFGQLASSD
ncbi:hypothetical protein CGRA01v4_05291 [Colletotrichum graminicola]|nr:hypothetical protein CGRA01v4_05291 [Colletotrichum graminicola]